MRAAARAALAAIALCAVAGVAEPEPTGPSEDAPVLEAAEVPPPPPDTDAVLRAKVLDPGLAAAPSYLRANVKDADGAWAYVHFTPDDAPIVVAVGMPKDPPQYASRSDGREAVLDGIRLWVRALRPHVPWFAVQFVDEDPQADVEIEWKRRITGPYAGFGGIQYRIEGGALRVFGQMEISTRPSPTHLGLTVEEIQKLTAHEFGHVLGLGHCLSCDSIMNYSWETQRVLVTSTDVKTYLELLAQPNGVRHTGGPLAGLAMPGWAFGAP